MTTSHETDQCDLFNRCAIIFTFCPSFYICKIAVGSVLLSKLKIFIGFFYTFVVSLQKTFINPLELEHQHTESHIRTLDAATLCYEKYLYSADKKKVKCI